MGSIQPSDEELKRIQLHVEEDEQYIRDCDLRGLLTQLVKDTAKQRTSNMYEFMYNWAKEQQTKAQRVDHF